MLATTQHRFARSCRNSAAMSMVDGADPIARIDHEHDQIGLFDRDVGPAPAMWAGQAGVQAGVHAAGVHDEEGLPADPLAPSP